MSKQVNELYDILSNISVMAGDARNILAMADQTPEASEIHEAIGAAIRVGIEYLHQIEQLADSVYNSEQSV